MLVVLAAIPVVFWDLSASDHGFVATGDLVQWTWGVPTSGPGGADAVWGTRLDGDYLNDAVEYLELPSLDLTGLARPVVVFRHWYSIQPGDAGYFEVDSGGGFAAVDPIYGYPDPAGFTGASDWSDVSVDLSGFGTSPRVRLAFTADLTLADEGWYLATAGLYDGDATPPQLSALAVPGDTQVLDTPYRVSLLAVDDVAVTAVDVYYTIDGGPEEIAAAVDMGGGVWDADIPAQAPDTDVSWYAVAGDGAQTVQLPELGTQDFRVFLAAPENFAGPLGGRLVGDEVTLTWDPPVSPHQVLSYVVADTVDQVEVSGLQATLQVDQSSPMTWTVTAIYDVGAGDPSSPLSLDLEVPTLDSVGPSSAFQGESVRVALQGTSLYLFQGLSTVDLGSEIQTTDLEVVDVNSAVVVLALSDEAEVGLRTVTLAGTQGVFSFPDAFEVLDGADAPRVVSTEPAFGIQGEQLKVRVKVSEPFSGSVTVAETEDLFVTDVRVNGNKATIDLVISNSARLGDHTLVLDDGVRLWSTPFEVRERVFRSSTTCLGCATGRAPGLSGSLLLLFLVRRRR